MLIAWLWSEEMAVTVPQYSHRARSRGKPLPQFGHKEPQLAYCSNKFCNPLKHFFAFGAMLS